MKRESWLIRLNIFSGLLILILFLMMGLSISWGSADLRLADVWRVVLAHLVGGASVDSATDAIVWNIRLPRVILSALIGAALAGAGVVFQGVLRNPLADPYILGVSSGAALGAALALLTGLGTNPLGRMVSPPLGLSVCRHCALSCIRFGSPGNANRDTHPLRCGGTGFFWCNAHVIDFCHFR